MNTLQARPEARYGHTQGVRLLQTLADEGHFLFTTGDAKFTAGQLGIMDDYVHELLSDLERGGWLMRLRRGLYAIAGGAPWGVRIHPFVIATHLVAPSAISHWSAMSHHGFTEQIPHGVFAVTTRKVITPSMRGGSEHGGQTKHAWEIAGIRYEYTTVKPEHFFGFEEVWMDDYALLNMTDKERTILDGFVSPRTFGGMGEVLGILEEQAHDLDLKKLVGYALQYGKASVAKRLGWSLEQVGVSDSVLAPLEELPISGTRRLDPTRPERGPHDKRWRIQNNLTATPA